MLKTALVVLLVSAIVLMSMFPKTPGKGTFQSVVGPTAVFTAARAAALLVAITLLAGAQRAAFHQFASAHRSYAPDPSDQTCAMLC